MRLAAHGCALLAFALVPSVRGDMITATADPAATDRFYSGADPHFAFSQYDLTGIGNTQGASGRGQWATMVSPTFFVSAFHDHPGMGSDLTFYSADGQAHTYAVAGGERITAAGVAQGQGDLYLGWLSAPIPKSAGISWYHIVVDDPKSLSGAAILAVGSPWRVGTGIIDEGPYGSSAESFGFGYDPGTVGGPYAAYVQPGDSGAPSFVVGADGSLLLAGTHWLNTGSYVPGGYNESIDSFISPGVSAFDAAMTALGSSEQISVAGFGVPEASSVALLCVGVGAAAALRIRRGRPGASR
jgi:hypothetical protein